ncbi:putative uncharacterized protein [Parachlamydia acanthamoebae UV-7]|uniref:asparagine synthase (glutamine-hydrolyzing) n=2 Tax=Parachlamydia acanthamoebae TaxID=83552 RepID=F8KZ92_PARAV|nr:asparagine synthase (glutamine-hydrolyzing) [Parachlamydia acanthamoebae]CCB86221.1 putative uncharacterized protein [Parachlamydia acanthamoebae UV-7]
MEGIAGIVYPDIFQMNNLSIPLLNALKMRGGNVSDSYTFRNIELGCVGTKLFILPKKNIVLAFDGNLYNLKDLHKELTKTIQAPLKLNVRELILAAYICWGPSFLKYLDGDFALAILDQEKERMIIARDRIGKKPLYWYHQSHYFIFASELKAILATGVVAQTPAIDAFAAYLTFGYVPQDMSPIQNICKLLPGHYLQLNFDGSKFIESYWSYSSYFKKSSNDSKRTLLSQLDALIYRSVEARMPENKPVGCFLSGGLGSASIAYYMRKVLEERPFAAFTVGFEKENEEDVKAAKETALQFHLLHYTEQIPPSDLLSDLVKIIWYLDEPLADPNIVATWRLAKLASTKTHTVFSGMGSDEIFAGHNRYTTEEREQSFFSPLAQFTMQMMRSFLIPLLSVVNKSWAYPLLRHAGTNPWQFNYMKKNTIFSEREIARAAPKLAGLFDPEVFLHKFHHLERIKSLTSSFLYFDVKTRLPDCFILQYERLTTAHQLQWCTPFLDHHLIEYLATFQEPEYLDESETASFLKAIMKAALPSSVAQRPKKTRQTFLREWLITPQIREVFLLLKRGSLVESGLISLRWVQMQIDQLQTSPYAFKYLWSVLILEIWFRLYINRPISSEPPNLSVKEILLEY